ncbi:ATP-grasp domain-containing protein [Lysinibacter cavernae]|uniref:ATP-grasp domain-containing protein n=1 Tax=Lysinibacter cavernae TaxID=1640652 RepID=UPI00361DEF7E
MLAELSMRGDRPCGTEHPDATVAAERLRLHQLYATYVEEPSGALNGDVEEFLEEACRLDAAIQVFGENNVILKRTDGRKLWAKREEQAPLSAELEDCVILGGQMDTALRTDPRLATERLADKYMFSKTFTQNSGRKTYLTTFDDYHDDEPKAARSAFKALYGSGVRRMVAKAVVAKQGFRVVDLTHTRDEAEGWQTFVSETFEGFTHSHGDESILLQEWVEMEYEYRIFVVGHELVTGAGSVVEHTPLDNNGLAFNTTLRRHRIDYDPCADPALEEQPEVVTRYREFGERMANAFRAERPNMPHYVLDVATVNGETVIVELNGLRNSGLFATDHVAVVKALRRFEEEQPYRPQPAVKADSKQCTVCGGSNTDVSFPLATAARPGAPVILLKGTGPNAFMNCLDCESVAKVIDPLHD